MPRRPPHLNTRPNPAADDSTTWLRQPHRITSRESANYRQVRYGRSLAWVHEPDGTLVNLLSLSQGMSRLLDTFGLPADLEPSLRQAASEAQILHLGIWKKRSSGERRNRT
ncbi:MAG UNVERIFIED_CONTAM: hypothetical protein LVR18_28390 [Planctomycetaceae bacterium]